MLASGVALLIIACSAGEPRPAEPNHEDGGDVGSGGVPREWTCEEDPTCDPPFPEGPECDIYVMSIPLDGNYGGQLNALGGAGGLVICLEPVR